MLSDKIDKTRRTASVYKAYIPLYTDAVLSHKDITHGKAEYVKNKLDMDS